MGLTDQATCTSDRVKQPKNVLGALSDRPALPPIVVRDVLGRRLDTDSGQW